MGKDDLILSAAYLSEFRTYLKKGGCSATAIARVLDMLGEYESFLAVTERDLDTSTADDLLAFVDEIESAPKKSGKTHLWAIRYY